MEKQSISSKALVGVNPTVKPSGTGCVECLALATAGQDGVWWLHLRRCAECGHIGCCDSSPNTHATKHFHATKHPVIQSFEKEDHGWFYNYTTDQELDGMTVKLADPQYHPTTQSVPFYPPVAAKQSRRRKAA
jgi:hypothetical protein